MARLYLLAATALGSAVGGTAWAQDAQSGGANSLAEVVVTATRREESVNRVPLSITAVTQASLDQQGIRNLGDLTRSVPALTFRKTGSDGTMALAVRGVFSNTGSPTTGIFLDDTPLQKRLQGVTSAGGTPIPELFDLERVEVLRGPQGTLFGGSSQGGAVRFIQPTPSVTRYSVFARAEAAGVRDGSPSAELGVAVGGPIIQDKLGFRVSVDSSHVGGYIDHIRPASGVTWGKNTNSEDHFTFRTALRWTPTADDDVTLSWFRSRVDLNDTDYFWEDVPAYTLPAGTFDAKGLATTNPALINYRRPAVSYPALDFYGPYKSGSPQTWPRRNELDVASLTYNHSLGWADLKSITSFIHDKAKSLSDIPNDSLNNTGSSPGLFGGYLAASPDLLASFHSYNRRTAWSQELRLSSTAKDSRLTWVIGGFYMIQHTSNGSRLIENTDAYIMPLRGVSSAVFYGIAAVNDIATATDVSYRESSLAAFGEASFAVTSKLKATAGVRASREGFDLVSGTFGQTTRVAGAPTLANGQLTVGSLRESPVSPKFGLSYQLTDADLLYATVSRGFRPGGLNGTLPPQCAAASAAIGGAPKSFAADYALSYEGGAKLRLFDGRAQINSSVFRTAWSGVQTRLSLPGCSFFYTANSGDLVSKGFDTQASIRVTHDLTVDISVGYAHVAYSKTVTPVNATAIIVNAGDSLPTPAWTVNVGARYDFDLLSKRAYIRGDFDYSGKYFRTFGPGATTYGPDVYNAKPVYTTNLRAGMVIDKFDVSLFVNNLFSFKGAFNLQNGRTGCATAACTGFTTDYLDLFANTVRPFTAGMTVAYRY